MTAYNDLYGYESISNSLCRICCDIMYYGADLFNMSYEAFNYLCLYLIQPSIYIIFMIFQILVLCKHNKLWVFTLGIPIFYMDYLLEIANTNWTLLGSEKIKTIFKLSQEVGLAYSELNIFLFILCFIFICLLQLCFMFCNKTFKPLLLIIYIVISPYFIFVFFT